MSPYLPVFDSPAGEAACMAAYQAVLDRWSARYTECDIPTSFGVTHAIVSGPDDKPALVLMHALFASAVSWYRSVGRLSEHFKVYAVDILGEANKSKPSRPMKSLDDLAAWLSEFLDQVGIGRAYLAGNSMGAFTSAYFAMRCPDRVRRLALIGPAATFRQIMPFYINMFLPKVVYMFLPRLPGRERAMEHTLDWMYAGLPRDEMWDCLFYQLMLHGTTTTQVFPRVYRPEELSLIQAPTMLLLGDHERVYQPEAAIRDARTRMPGIRVKTIPEAHHITALAQPELVNRELIAFFLEDPDKWRRGRCGTTLSA